jgi:hypothetical protein
VAGSGLAGKNVMLVDETRKFQLPASFYVYVSGAGRAVVAQLLVGMCLI